MVSVYLCGENICTFGLLYGSRVSGDQKLLVVRSEGIDGQITEPLTGINTGQLRTGTHATVRELPPEVAGIVNLTGGCDRW